MSLASSIRIILISCLIASLSACASRVVVNVNAISDPQMADYGKRYYLTNVNQDIATNDLYFLEFRRYFDHILKKQGLKKAESREDADIEIQFQYGISDGRTAVQTYSWPIYETFGGYSVTVTEKITDSEGKTRTVQRTSYVPAHIQRVGSTYETRSYTIYNRYANLAALPIRTIDSKQPTPIWSINIHSVGETSDLRAIMPYLAAASVPFLGRNSGQQQVFELSHDDPMVVELRNLIFTKP